MGRQFCPTGTDSTGGMRSAPEYGWRRSQLTYCSNVHTGASLAGVQDVIKQQIASVRRLRGLNSMGSGLWLSAQAAEALCSDIQAMEDFSQLLHANGLTLFTLNGFPYDNFHITRVKEQVYQPNWAAPERLAYTLNLAKILAVCLPDSEPFGSISTLPLGFIQDWNEETHKKAVDALCQLAKSLDELKKNTGRHIRVCLEMEPGCVLESSEQAIAFFSCDLASAAIQQGLPKRLIFDYLGICFDICHQAVMFEEPAQSLAQFRAAGITIGKIQISSALELKQPADGDPKKALSDFAEPRYFHQVRTKNQDARLAGKMDLPDLFIDEDFPHSDPWRIHFHVPIQVTTTQERAVGTTQDAILQVLEYLQHHPGFRPHLEVETYTWQLLPPALRPTTDADLHKGLVEELSWLEDAMHSLNLLQDHPQ